MRIYRDINNLPSFNNAVITIGSFDGVHRGHQKIIARLNQLAKEIEGESIIITFDPHPRKTIYPKDNTLEVLNTLNEKIELCEKYGLDIMVIVPFSIEFSQQIPREYIENFLIKSFHPKYIVIGYDHRFGLNREGNIDLLKQYSKNEDFQVVEIKKQELEEITISSSKIRLALKNGNIEEASKFLNHPYKLTGKIIHGDKIGTKIGYPTANVSIADKDKLIPAEGVYAVRCEVEGLVKNGMLYIGRRPTLEGKDNSLKIEVNLFDFNDDIYDKIISIDILEHIRGDMKFESLDELKLQLSKDQKNVLDTFQSEVNTQNIQDKVCIAILNYNGEEFLEAYLPEILYSSKSLINVAVIDNCSTDESSDYLQEWHPEVQLIELAKNYGFAEGYNRGMAHIHAEYTVILNSDVEVKKYWLDPILEKMDADPSIGVAQPKILDMDEKSNFEYAGACGGYLDILGYPYCRGRIFDTVEKDEGQYNTIENIDWASGAAMVVRTSLFKKLGGFDKDYFAHMEEIDFCHRVRASGYKVVVIPESTVYHLGGGTLSYSSPKKVYLNFRNSLATLFKNEDGLKLLWLIPLRLILDGIACLKFLIGGKFANINAVLHAHWSFYGAIGSLAKKKQEYSNLIEFERIGPSIRNSKFSRSIVWDYYLMGKKRFSDLIK